jgi:hypothetical protein
MIWDFTPGGGATASAERSLVSSGDQIRNAGFRYFSL